MPLLGIDVFAGNSDSLVTASINRLETIFVINKATEGMFFDDTEHDAIRNETLAAGKVPGSYHFGWLSQDPIIEAHHFLDRVQPIPGQLLAIDFEDWGENNPAKPKYAEHKAMRDATSWSERKDYALAILDTVWSESKCRPLAYVNWNYLKGFRTACSVAEWEWLTDFPLWLAQWQMTYYENGVKKVRAVLPGETDIVSPKEGSSKGWPVTFHQWSNAYNSLDADWFYSGIPRLMTYTVGAEGGSDMSAEQYAAIMGKLETVQGSVDTKFAELGDSLDMLEQNITTNVSTAVMGAVQQQLSGVTINTSIGFPTGQ